MEAVVEWEEQWTHGEKDTHAGNVLIVVFLRGDAPYEIENRRTK